MARIIAALLLAGVSSYGFAGQELPAFSDDIQDYDAKSGIGCISKTPVSKGAEFYFVCKSLRSDEHAWSAALYRGKLACGGHNFSVFFNVPPRLPKENNSYAVQVELKCQ